VLFEPVVFESRSLALRFVQAFRLNPQGRLCSHGAYTGVVDAASHPSVKPTVVFLGNDLSADFVPLCLKPIKLLSSAEMEPLVSTHRPT
jgi:Na+-transporting methylmalonyl-CoA/oxaloacetate decarboxylase beta subunit